MSDLGSTSSSERRLEADSIGLTGAVAQLAALIGPATGAIVGSFFVAGLAGPATSLVFVIGTAVCLCIAKVVGDHARYFPSAVDAELIFTHDLHFHEKTRLTPEAWYE